MSLRSKIATSVLLVMAGILVIFGIGDIGQGPTADPAITTAISGKMPAEVAVAEPTGYRLYDFAIRMGGLNLVLIGLLMTSILAVPYRLGMRWAWTTMWLLPAWAITVPVLFIVYGPAPGTPLPPPAISGPILAVIAGGALLADRGRFAGRQVRSETLGVAPA